MHLSEGKVHMSNDIIITKNKDIKLCQKIMGSVNECPLGQWLKVIKYLHFMENNKILIL